MCSTSQSSTHADKKFMLFSTKINIFIYIKNTWLLYDSNRVKSVNRTPRYQTSDYAWVVISAPFNSQSFSANTA